MTKPVALFDLDGTLCDYAGAMERDLTTICGPSEVLADHLHADDDKDPPWLRARKKMIKRQPGWWRDLQPMPDGMVVIEMARAIGFKIHILTKGPKSVPSAWAEKVEWCAKWLPDYPVTLASDKSLVYGRVLVDDWPSYVGPWLKRRPRGAVLMPKRPWNNDFFHARATPYDSSNFDQVRYVLEDQFERIIKTEGS